MAAVAAGDLTPADAGEISKLIEAYVKAFETVELVERLDDEHMIGRSLENRLAGTAPRLVRAFEDRKLVR